jgi:hypothetical protein
VLRGARSIGALRVVTGGYRYGSEYEGLVYKLCRYGSEAAFGGQEDLEDGRQIRY